MCGCQLLRHKEQIEIPSWEQPIHLDGKINSASEFMAQFSKKRKFKEVLVRSSGDNQKVAGELVYQQFVHQQFWEE
jgi:hypothetical protein